MRCAFLLVVLPLLAACSEQEPPSPQSTSPKPAFNIDATRMSVSGISSGAYMAGQLHLAHAELFGGVALIAGGPWYCAQNSIQQGLGPCMNGEGIDVAPLVERARAEAGAGRLASMDELSSDAVWILHGAQDAVVAVAVADAARALYASLAPGATVALVNDVPVAHGFPTLETGGECGTMAPPFLNACGYDAAGTLLAALHGDIAARTHATGKLMRIPQPGADGAGMLEDAFLYVPADCAAGASCGIHVALHGCQQSSEFVDTQFATGAGYNEWAESNRLLVLYPQVASSKIAPLNPLGCWDWWGYTGDAYATREGPQVAVIKATLDALAGRAL